MFIVSLRKEVLLLFLMIRMNGFHKELLQVTELVIDIRKLNEATRKDHYPLPVATRPQTVKPLCICAIPGSVCWHTQYINVYIKVQSHV